MLGNTPGPAPPIMPARRIRIGLSNQMICFGDWSGTGSHISGMMIKKTFWTLFAATLSSTNLWGMRHSSVIWRNGFS